VNLAESKLTLLEEQKTSKKQSWWQKLSQSINLAGTWLFLQVLFVSHNTTIAMQPNLSMSRGNAWRTGSVHASDALCCACNGPLHGWTQPEYLIRASGLAA
jgi:hypothetical protein